MEEKSKSNLLLKIMSILMIIGGIVMIIVRIIVSAIAVIGTIALGDLMLIMGSLLAFLSSIFMLIAGIIGVKNAAKPAKAKTCIVMGVIVVALSVLGTALTTFKLNSFGLGPDALTLSQSLTFGLALPVLYIIGALQLKKRA